MLSEIINSILPVYLLIFLGWFSIKSNVFDLSAKRVCARLVSHYVFPALLFMETSQADPSKIFDIKWLLAFLVSMLLIWLITFLVNRYYFKENSLGSAMKSMACAFPNMGGMGIPFLTYVIGTSALISIAKANFIVSMVLIPLTIIFIEGAKIKNTTKTTLVVKSFLRSFKQPMFLAVIIGSFFSFSGLTTYIPIFITSSLHGISQACVFVSLFAVGTALYGIKIRFSQSLLFNLLIKSILSGFIALGVTHLFGLTGNDARELVYLLALPTATMATVLSIEWNIDVEEIMSIYLITTILSIITLPVFMYILR